MPAALTGGCLCGAVRFEIDRRPETVSYCHCTRCQRRTGTGSSAQAAIEPGWLTFTSGDLDTVRWWRPPDGFAKGFCPQCGAHLFSRHQADPSRMSVRLGALDGDHGLRPQFRIHVASAASWEPVPQDGLPGYEGSRPVA